MSKIPQTKKRLLIYRLKEARNLIRNHFYIHKSSGCAKKIVDQLEKTSAKEICITVAFNTPWTIDLLIECWLTHCKETTLLVIDNSSSTEKANKIREICKSKQVPYLKLPPNPVKHPSRSHGLALNWTWKNIILNLKQLTKVGFIDHDCYPIKPCQPNYLSKAFAYGVPKSSWIEGSRAINIWAGFTFFASNSNLSLLKFKFNFLPDALHGLDTGGMNWHAVYKHLKKSEMAEAKNKTISASEFFQTGQIEQKWSLQLIEETFIHISGVSHKKEFDLFGRNEFCQLLRERMTLNKLNST